MISTARPFYLVHDASQAIPPSPRGVTVTIDLAGYTLTNDPGQNDHHQQRQPDHYGFKGIGRVVKESNGIALFNNGTLAISGGTFGTVALKPGNQNITVSGGKFKEKFTRTTWPTAKVCTASGDAGVPLHGR